MNVSELIVSSLLFITVAILSVLFATFASKILTNRLIKLQIPKNNDDERMKYTLTVIQDVNVPYLLIENTGLKFLRFQGTTKRVFFLISLFTSFLSLSILILQIKNWLIVGSLINFLFLVGTFISFLFLAIFPLLMFYFFLEVILNCDEVIESILLILIPLITLFISLWMINSDLSQMLLLMILGLIFLPTVLLSANFVAMNYPGVIVTTIQWFRRNWDYLVFQKRKVKLSKTQKLKHLTHVLLFLVPFPFLLLINILLSVFPNFLVLSSTFIILVLGLSGLLDAGIILAMIVSFFRYGCFTSAIDQISVDDPEGVIPQTAVTMLAYGAFLLFIFIGLVFNALTLAGYGPTIDGMYWYWELFRKFSWILISVFYVSVACFLFIWDFRIYPTECGIIVLTDNEWEFSLSFFPLFKLIKKNLEACATKFEFLKEKDLMPCVYCGYSEAHWEQSRGAFYCDNCQNEW
ncbi:MAG: hypothetical protein ACFFCZ_10865 [Promethearchaeota archaeon]